MAEADTIYVDYGHIEKKGSRGRCPWNEDNAHINKFEDLDLGLW